MIDGVTRLPFVTHADDRGDLTEAWRVSWQLLPDLLQWNLVRSDAGVLRGVHVHLVHREVVVVVNGHLRLGLHDLRPGSCTYRQSQMLDISGDTPGAVVLPSGVAHGFLTAVDTTVFIGMTEEYDPADDIAMRWDDPALSLEWGCTNPRQSARDRDAPPVDAVIAQLAG